MEWAKKHIALIITIVLIIALILPLGINALYLITTDCEVLHKPSEWTMFWGAYLGAIISAAVAFIILHIQRKDNEQQIKDTQNDNEAQNNANRELQVRTIKYQQAKYHYDKLCMAGVENISSYKLDELLFNLLTIATIDLAKLQAAKDLQPYLLVISSVSEKLDRTNSVMSLLANNNTPSGKEYHIQREETYKVMQDLLYDLKLLIVCSSSKDIEKLKTCLTQQSSQLSIEAKKRIENYIQEHSSTHNSFTFVSDVIMIHLKSQESLYERVKEYTHKFIQLEKERIDNILTEDKN